MNQVIQGDCLEVMRGMADCSVDAVVTDPPYGLSFMGRAWDYDVPKVEIWREVLRVLKPGGHLLSFAGSRTHHRMAVNIEDAGFDLRDTLMWVYGSGFPKSLDVSKAIDRAAGAEREIVGERLTGAAYSRADRRNADEGFESGQVIATITAPATEAARQWEGWGSALKPAFEPVILARKPLQGTIAQNVQEWGTGALNIAACRVGTGESTVRPVGRTAAKGWGLNGQAGKERGSTAGRWPANVIHDGSEEVVGCFPESVSRPVKPENIGKSGSGEKRGIFGNGSVVQSGYKDDESSAARFFKQCPDTDTEDAETRRLFYCGKATKRDRDEGLEGFEEGAYTLKNDCPEHIKKEIEAWLTSRF